MAETSTCQCCGEKYSKICDDESYIGKNCFDCSFWLEKIKMSPEDEAGRVIVNGQHYRIGNDAAGPFRGFGGRKFTVLFQDGRIVETTNLWCQGEIPERFRKMLPDNAVFLKIAEKARAIHSINGGDANGMV